MLARFEPVGLILSPFLPVGGANFYWPPRFGVDPGISETATGEDERMQLVFIRDRKVQIAIGRNFVNGADKEPHAALIGPSSGHSALIYSKVDFSLADLS